MPMVGVSGGGGEGEYQAGVAGERAGRAGQALEVQLLMILRQRRKGCLPCSDRLVLLVLLKPADRACPLGPVIISQAY